MRGGSLPSYEPGLRFGDTLRCEGELLVDDLLRFGDARRGDDALLVDDALRARGDARRAGDAATLGKARSNLWLLPKKALIYCT